MVDRDRVVALFALIHGVATYHYGEAAGYTALLLFNLAAPASLVIVVLGDSFVDAVNPWRVAGVMSRTGFDYFAACFVVALLSLTGNMVLDLVLSAAAPALRLFIYVFCSYYYLLAVFFMMGWLVAWRRDELIG